MYMNKTVKLTALIALAASPFAFSALNSQIAPVVRVRDVQVDRLGMLEAEVKKLRADADSSKAQLAALKDAYNKHRHYYDDNDVSWNPNTGLVVSDSNFISILTKPGVDPQLP
jgi:hypothetical protein